MADREKVPSVFWTGGGSNRQAGKHWVAVFANEGPEKLADYIRTLRGEYLRMKADARYTKDEIDDLVATGKHAVRVYNKHFGEI